MIALSCGIKILTVHCLVLSQYMRVTDGQTDRQTDKRTDRQTVCLSVGRSLRQNYDS